MAEGSNKPILSLRRHDPHEHPAMSWPSASSIALSAASPSSCAPMGWRISPRTLGERRTWRRYRSGHAARPASPQIPLRRQDRPLAAHFTQDATTSIGSNCWTLRALTALAGLRPPWLKIDASWLAGFVICQRLKHLLTGHEESTVRLEALCERRGCGGRQR
jgi:hypothetical protein